MSNVKNHATREEKSKEKGNEVGNVDSYDAGGGKISLSTSWGKAKLIASSFDKFRSE